MRVCRALLPSLLVLALSATPGEAQKVVSLSPDRCHFFGTNFYTGSEFLALLNTGEYVRIDREHMFTEESDRGRWTQDPDAVVRLRSHRRFHDVEFGSLRLYFGQRKPEAIIPGVKAALRSLLEKNRYGKSFEVSQVKKINELSVDAAFESEERRIPRSDVSGMLAALEAFEKSTDQNEFRLIPISYRGRIFVEWQNEGVSLQRDRKWLMETIDESPDDPCPGFVPIDISRETFREAAGTTQPFVFHPEMNREDGDPEAEKRVQDLTRTCP